MTQRSYTHIVALLTAIAAMTLFGGAYLHDEYNLLTEDQVFIAPFICILFALITVTCAINGEDRE